MGAQPDPFACRVYSLGADGETGGTGLDAEVVLWASAELSQLGYTLDPAGIVSSRPR